MATCYTQACVLKNKQPQSVLRGVFKFWIYFFGSPSKFFSDNGGEFNNSEMKDLCDMYNIRLMYTAAWKSIF